MNTYLNDTNGQILNLVKRHEQNKCIQFITSDAEKYLNGINLDTGNTYENSSSTENVNEIKGQAKNKITNKLKEVQKDKPLHGKCPIFASDLDVNSSLAHQCLASTGLKSETEGFIIAVQCQGLTMPI